jgi:DNA modification methylase
MIHLGDCLDIMASMEDSSVDAVFTDPPYNAGKDYGEEVDDSLPEWTYRRFMRDVVEECKRVSGGNVLFYVDGKLTSLFYELIPDAHLIIVQKRAIGIRQNNYTRQYHSLFSTMKPLIPTRDLWEGIRLPGEGYFFTEERHDNPGLTSLVLTKKAIDTFTERGDTVLDPFMGSGTTGVACYELSRGFVGIELSKKQFGLAEGRLVSARQQLILGV